MISKTRPALQVLVWQSWLSELCARFECWWSSYLTWQLERAATRQLGSLSDRQLKDIGLDRSEILRAVREQKRRVFSRY
jgi:uncharacterized protein YjiS (DUF1127 family)